MSLKASVINLSLGRLYEEVGRITGVPITPDEQMVPNTPIAMEIVAHIIDDATQSLSSFACPPAHWEPD